MNRTNNAARPRKPWRAAPSCIVICHGMAVACPGASVDRACSSHEYELFAVRELIVNAFCHRDWSVYGQKIRVTLFDDRLAIFSPGALPNSLSLANALAGVSYYRNPNIAQLCKDYELAERAGRGLQKIFRTFRERHLPPPEVIDDPMFFQVVLQKNQLHSGP